MDKAQHNNGPEFASIDSPGDSVEGEGQNSIAITVTPSSNKKAFLARLCLLDELANPKAYSRSKKWLITSVVAVAGIGCPIGSAIFFPALYRVSEDFNTSVPIANLSASLYLLSLAIFPLWWSAISERFGRRIVYLSTFVLFALFNVLGAYANSIAVLLVMRLLSGGASSSSQTIGPGTIADVWEPKERGKAMGLFWLGPLCGPMMAPVIGGALSHEWRWRSTLWFLAIYGVVMTVLILVALPETHRRAADTGTEGDVERPGRRELLKILLLDPLKSLRYLRRPPVLLTVYYGSVIYGILYAMSISIEHTFQREPYRYSTIITGLLYIPNSLGYIVASIIGGRWMDYIMQREARKANRYAEDGSLIYYPEDRVRENAWIASVLCPVGLIWYGWTAERGVVWPVPITATFFFGIGCMLIFNMCTTMLTEFLPRKPSAGIAINNLVRNALACVGTVITAPGIEAIGNGWLFTIVGILGLVSSLVLLAMKVRGPKWRQSMDALERNG